MRIKEHINKYKEVYIIASTAVIVAGITYVIMRDVKSQSISRGIAVTADRSIAVVGKKIEMNNVSYFSSNRQGPPSWVVRCLETNQIFTSQRAAAIGMGLAENELSSHLNGIRDHVRDFHFERICMVA